MIAVLCVVLSGCQGDQEPQATAAFELTDEIVQQHNQGVALMGRFDYPAAHDVLAQLVAEYPDWPDVKVDLAIAKLNRRMSTDTEDARRLLQATTTEYPQLTRARFCYALLLSYEGQSEQALPLFQEVLAQDPQDAYAAYYAGQCCLDLDNPAGAVEFFATAERLDPSLRSSYYGAFQARQRLGQGEDAKRELEMFQKLAANPQARLAEMKYSRMGTKADIQAVSMPRAELALPTGPLFVEPATLSVSIPAGAAQTTWTSLGGAEQPAKSAGNAVLPSITTCDINHDGLLDVFVAAGTVTQEGTPANAVLLQTRAMQFQLDTDHSLAKTTQTNAAVWGDFDNDGLVDVYLCRRGANQLWRQLTRGQWSDVTASSGTDGGDVNTIDGAMFDADHDGDLDLFVVNADGPCELLNNNLDGTFRGIGPEQGLQLQTAGASGIVVADLDADRDADIIVIHAQGPHEVFVNDRLWSYRKAEGFELFVEAPCFSAVAADVDGDGRLDLLTSGAAGLTLWQAGAEGTWAPHDIPVRLGPLAAGPLSAQDFDGDGQVEALVTTSSGWSIVTLGHEPRVLHEEVCDGPVFPMALAALSASAGPAVLRPETGQAPTLWRAGSGRFPFVTLEFTGKNNLADQMRSNASGIGVQAAARVGRRWSTLQTFRGQSGPGQSLQPLYVGLGNAASIDFVSMLWPDGLLQTEMQLAAGTRHQIEEVQRQVSSCPVIFAWDGNCMRFITDILGVGGLGFNLSNGQYAPPRPHENLLLPPDVLVARDGLFELSVAEPMEEACYLDSMQLIAYDLPPGWQMTLDERQATGEPACSGKPVFYRSTIEPNRCTTTSGMDVTATLAVADGDAVGAERLDRRFLGRTEGSGVTLEFDEPLGGEHANLVLVMDGWIEYPYSQTMFAAWQAGASYEAVSLEACSADGRWQPVYDAFGYPAGMPRQMSLPIDPARLPDSTVALRLTTNMEIYWDRIILVRGEPCPDAKVCELKLESAEVREIGFPRRDTTSNRRPAYTYGQRVPLWDTRHQAGYYSRFGNVLPLVTNTDDAVAIFGPGEETRLRFAELSHWPAAGWTRRYVIQAHGWCKDMDLYTRDGESILPLPRRGGDDGGSDPQQVDEHRHNLHREFNQRYRAG